MLASISFAGCAEEQYIYRPAEQATATVSGLPAARYAIPPERPRGPVLVASWGVTDFTTDNTKSRVLLVRLIVANNAGPASFTFDTREQIVFLPRQGQSRPAFINTKDGRPPGIRISGIGGYAVRVPNRT